MARGPNLEIWALESTQPILNAHPGFHPTRSTSSSPALTGGVAMVDPETRVISTGLNSRNIYPNPIDSLREYQTSEKEICYEADKEEHCTGYVRFNMSVGVRWNKK